MPAPLTRVAASYARLLYDYLAAEGRDARALLGPLPEDTHFVPLPAWRRMLETVDALEARPALDHWKARHVDLSRVLAQPDVPASYGRRATVPQEHGVEAMQRLQRELTTRFFLRNDERILITFSAGVAQWMPSETATEAIRRADQGMYLAKRAGKNRVVAA